MASGHASTGVLDTMDALPLFLKGLKVDVRSEDIAMKPRV